MIKLRRTIFSRLLLFNLAFIVAATLITQMIYYQYFNRKYLQESTRNNLLLVEQIRRSVDERVLEKVISIPVNYLCRLQSNYALVYPMDHNIAHESGAILNASRRLDELKNAYEFIHSVDLYYPAGNLIFVNSTVCFLNGGDASRKYLPVWLTEYQKKGWEKRKTFWLPLHNNGISNEEIVTYVNRTQQGEAIMGINIKREFIQKILAVMKLDPQGLIWIFDGSGKLVVNDGNRLPPERIRRKLINRILSLGKSGMFSANLGGVPLVISFSQSSHNNWRYISLIPAGHFYEKSRRVMLFAVLLGGVLLLLNLLGSIAVTKKAHKPLAPVLRAVGSLAAKFGDAPETQDEYQMLNATLDTLAGTIEDLTQKLDENKPVIRHNLIADLLYGRIGYEQWQSNYQQIYGHELNQDLFGCFLIRLKGNPAKPNPDFQSKMLVAYNLINILEQQDFPGKVRAIVGDDHQSIAGMINHGEGLRRAEMIKKITGAIGTIYQGRYQLGLGNSYQPIHDQVAHSFRQAQTALQYGFLFPKLKLLDYQRIQPETLRPTGNLQRTITKIAEYLRAGSLEELKLTVHQLFTALVKDGYQVDFCRNTIADLISTLYNTAAAMGFDTLTVVGVDLRVVWKDQPDILTLKDWLEDCLAKLIAAVKESRDKFDEGLEIKVKQFIAANLTNELSLEKVADALHIRYDTLSRTFKAVTGLSFVDYVKELKMQNAANLLCEENLSVHEVANRLGYHSVPYFIKLFKAKYGFTPKEFQHRNRL
jgi:AraC-like DNA-binding protein